MTAQQSSTSKKGFTLIELMVSIAIVAILATVGMIVYSTAQKAGRISKRAQDLMALKTAIELYKASVGNYPNISSGGCIDTLLVGLVPAYMPVLPKDPLQSGNTNCYRYYTDGSSAPYLGSQYKVSTNGTLPASEMSDADFRRQPQLIDPYKDNTPVSGSSCVIDPAASGGVWGWAVYSLNGTSGSCLLTSEP